MTSWQPLLRGEAADRAIELIHAISNEIAHPWDTPWKWGAELREPYSLAYGKAGVALFFCYLAKTLCDEHCHAAFLFLDDSIRAAENGGMQQGVEVGACGIIWACQHIKNCIPLHERIQCSFAEWDRQFLEYCQADKMPTALADGLAGFCVYAAERMPDESAEKLLRAASIRIERTAEPMSCGVAWRVSGYAEQDLRHSFPALSFAGRRYSASVGYGVAGIVGALLATYLSGVRPDENEALIDAGVSWLLHQKCSADFPQMFALIAGVELPHISNGWYLGDPGVIAVILKAAIVFGREDWYSAVVTDAASTLRCKSRFTSFNLLGGSIGRAHICNRLFRMTDNAEFAEAAIEWYTLAIESYGAKGKRKSALESGRKFHGLYRGSAGLGLGLLAAISDVEPAWDSVFFGSFREPKTEFEQRH